MKSTSLLITYLFGICAGFQQQVPPTKATSSRQHFPGAFRMMASTENDENIPQNPLGQRRHFLAALQLIASRQQLQIVVDMTLCTSGHTSTLESTVVQVKVRMADR